MLKLIKDLLPSHKFSKHNRLGEPVKGRLDYKIKANMEHMVCYMYLSNGKQPVKVAVVFESSPLFGCRAIAVVIPDQWHDHNITRDVAYKAVDMARGYLADVFSASLKFPVPDYSKIWLYNLDAYSNLDCVPIKITL